MSEYTKAIVMAMDIAIDAHRYQYRKDGVVPYIIHPLEVAELVEESGGSPLAIVAAWLHDVIEDAEEPDIYRKRIHEEINRLKIPDNEKNLIIEMVEALTKDDSVKPRKKRDEENYQRILKAPPETILVKLCDRTHNLTDIDGMDKKFLATYVEESRELIKVFEEPARKYGYTSNLNSIKFLISRIDDYLGGKSD